MYPQIKEWLFDEAIPKAITAGNLATCAFNRTRIFFGNLHDNKTQREFAAFFGQGGTAGNINKSLDNIYYGIKQTAIAEYTKDVKEAKLLENLGHAGVQLLFQVHDSIIGQVPKEKLYLIRLVQLAMANTCKVNGKTFVVPTEAMVGLGWGKRMMEYRDDIVIRNIEDNDRKWWEQLA